MLVTSFGKTNVGRVRKHNEDAFVIIPEIGLWVVADGMGGHEGGEIASSIVCRTITQQVAKNASLKEAIQEAHRQVIAAAERGDGAPGMGSTVVALQIKGSQFEIAWVGDSRAYLCGQSLQLISHDHSYVQQLIDAGAITEDQAQTHPQRNLITQSVGSVINFELQVDSITGVLNNGDKLILCSDGLSGEVEFEQLESLSLKHRDPQMLVEAFINVALKNGGRDNVTAVVVTSPGSVGKLNNQGTFRNFFQKLSPFYSGLLPMFSIMTVLTLYNLLKSLIF
ncbi:MAG: protein phosphatase 2C domain-containing protein [Pseudomonadota bacterium]